MVVATIILVLFVLPAEYGKDPTGLGARLGVLNMSVEDENREEQKQHRSIFPLNIGFLEMTPKYQ